MSYPTAPNIRATHVANLGQTAAGRSARGNQVILRSFAVADRTAEHQAMRLAATKASGAQTRMSASTKK